ncbi:MULTISPECIES: hypothetical protein [unclassified Pseudomonas]|uniref:hypothetical protein n=1 Tax=unclassified Pseudomonas TaxID=196821 RepID=UPI000A1D5D21|nr:MULTISPECIES: hypothetical protein [unclassified Pseudomonas]
MSIVVKISMSESMKAATAWGLWGFLALGVLGWVLLVVLEYVGMSPSFKFDLATWLAICISVLALGTTLWQARLARAHNKLSVRPYLAGHSSWTKDGIYRLNLRNDGLGPAIITGARVYRDGVLVEGEGPPLVEKAFEGIPGCELLEHEFFYLEFVIPAGHCVEICSVKFGPEISDVDTFLASRIMLELDYKSAYEEARPMYTTRKT